MHIKIHEDNFGTIILDQLQPRQMTPHSKHYAVKYWFWEHIVPRKIQLVKLPPKINLVISLLKALIKLLSKICKRCSWVGRSHSALLRGSIAGIYLLQLLAHIFWSTHLRSKTGSYVDTSINSYFLVEHHTSLHCLKVGIHPWWHVCPKLTSSGGLFLGAYITNFYTCLHESTLSYLHWRMFLHHRRTIPP